MTQQLATPHPVRTWLFNPFHYIAGGQALGIGLGLIVVAGILAALSGTHFDGVLDLHTNIARIPLWLPVAEGVINWACMSIVLLPMGLMLSRSKVRTLDVIGTQALARWPMVLAALATLLPGYQQYTTGLVGSLSNENLSSLSADPYRLLMPEGTTPLDVAQLLVAILIIVVVSVWMVALMYRGFTVSCNVHGGRAAAGFVPGLILAEILSKVAIIYLVFTPLQAISMPQDAQPHVEAPGGASVKEAAQGFVEQLRLEQYDQAYERFDNTMKKALPTEKLATLWHDTVETYGPVQEIESIRFDQKQGYDRGWVICRFEKGERLAIMVVYDTSGKVSGLWFKAANEAPGLPTP